MAFKTGTSYGFRDAVAAGVVGGYVIVVWTGRADGGARGGLTGRDAALPLLFDVADAIGAPAVAPRADRAARPRRRRCRPWRGRRDGPAADLPARRRDGRGRRLRPGRARPGPGRRRRGPAAGTSTARRCRPIRSAARSIWRPAAPGFYSVTVVDAAGRSAEAQVRVKGG